MSWWKVLKGKVKFKEPLGKHTTFRIGGAAKLFIEPKDLNDLKQALILLKQRRIPVLVIGAGSNLLVSDQGLDKAVLKLGAPYFKKMAFEGTTLEAGAGVSLNAMVRACAERGLSGPEFLTGIPGTLAGALMMNAGQAKDGCSISNLVEEVSVMDCNGRVKQLSKRDIKFGYRFCGLSGHIILGARLKLRRKSKRGIASAVNKYTACRRGSQDYRRACAGCVFKNPHRGQSAGRLIDLCGLKGKRVGGASVSLKHANFIINDRGAKAADVLRLMEIIKKEVKNQFKVDLKPEIKIWR